MYQAHKLLLAPKSPWFHERFKVNTGSPSNIVFFNVSPKIVKGVLDIIYGKEIVVPMKEKGKFSWFLSKLGVKWLDCSSKEYLSKQSQSDTDISSKQLQASLPKDSDSNVQDYDTAGTNFVKYSSSSNPNPAGLKLIISSKWDFPIFPISFFYPPLP